MGRIGGEPALVYFWYRGNIRLCESYIARLKVKPIPTPPTYGGRSAGDIRSWSIPPARTSLFSGNHPESAPNRPRMGKYRALPAKSGPTAVVAAHQREWRCNILTGPPEESGSIRRDTRYFYGDPGIHLPDARVAPGGLIPATPGARLR